MKRATAFEKAFAFALRNGDTGRFTARGKTVDVLLATARQRQGDRKTAGQMRHMETAEISVSAAALGFEPDPGELVSLDGWQCQVADEGVANLPGGYQILLQTATS